MEDTVVKGTDLSRLFGVMAFHWARRNEDSHGKKTNDTGRRRYGC